MGSGKAAPTLTWLCDWVLHLLWVSISTTMGKRHPWVPGPGQPHPTCPFSASVRATPPSGVQVGSTGWLSRLSSPHLAVQEEGMVPPGAWTLCSGPVPTTCQESEWTDRPACLIRLSSRGVPAKETQLLSWRACIPVKTRYQ